MTPRSTIFTAIAYANAKPHIGHAYEYVLADALARYQKLMGREVFFCTGMDEHGQKIHNKATQAGKTPQQLVDEVSVFFKDLDRGLQVDYTRFIRTTDEDHKKTAQDLWMKMYNAGDIYEKEYSGLYCVGCEKYMTEKDLDSEGRCPDHLVVPQTLAGKNWFFRLSKYQDSIKQKIQNDELRIFGSGAKTEMLAFIEQGLEDVSFSRPKEVLSWGVEVPNDPSHVMYVWCDALTNYLTAAQGEFWNDTQMLNVIGKDITRFHTLYWPGMLLSAGLPLPQDILVHGFILSDGQKMSKTLGNVIDPVEVLEIYKNALSEKSILGDVLASEFFRYFFLKNISPFADGDVTRERMLELYNADLANGIGNLVNRVMKLSSTYFTEGYRPEIEPFPQVYTEAMDRYDVKTAFEYIFKLVAEADEYMQVNAPFKVVKTDVEKGKEMLHEMRKKVYLIARLLNPFMPQTSSLIKKLIQENTMPERPLFPRFD